STRSSRRLGAPADPLTLAHWRRTVAEIYATARTAEESDPEAAAAAFREARDGLFRMHPDSPITMERRDDWAGTRWFAYDPSWRIVADIERTPHGVEFEIDLAQDGMLRCARVGYARFAHNGGAASLALYWFEGYGGGLWVPFLDATSGA